MRTYVMSTGETSMSHLSRGASLETPPKQMTSSCPVSSLPQSGTGDFYPSTLLRGRFLSIILTIEKMLQSWFPHVKPSPTQTDGGTPVKKQKQHHSSAFPPPSSLVWLCSSDVETYASTHLKWLHMSPICSLTTPEPSLSRCATFTSPRGATQDNAVSSSTDLRMGPLHPLGAGLIRGPPPFKISSPCLERLLQAKESIIAPRMEGGADYRERGRFMC